MLRMFEFLQAELQGPNITNGQRWNLMDEVKSVFDQIKQYSASSGLFGRRCYRYCLRP